MKIKKTYQGAIPLNRISNQEDNSELNTYSTKYINDSFVQKDSLGNYAFHKFHSFTLSSDYPTASAELTIETKGRPVFISITGDLNDLTIGAWAKIVFNRDGTDLCQQLAQGQGTSQNIPFSMNYLDVVEPGTHRYVVTFVLGGGQCSFAEEGVLESPNFTVFEI